MAAVSFTYGKASNVDVKVFQRTSDKAAHPQISINQGDVGDYTIIGGGAVDNWTGWGNMLTASAPLLDQDQRVIGWTVSGKDHINSSPATVTAYAIGMKVIKTDNTSVPIETKCFTRESVEAAHPSASVEGPDIDSNYLIVGGGAVDNWTGWGNLLTASAPLLDSNQRIVGWTASGKDHLKSSPARVTAYAIGLLLNGESYNLDVKVTSQNSETAAHPESVISNRNRVVGGGAIDHWTGAGNLLTASAPFLDNTRERGIGWQARGKDHKVSSPAYVTAFAAELTPFNVVYNTVPQSSSPIWGHEVSRQNASTLEEAQNYALGNDAVTYFFRVRDGKTITIEGRGTFSSGDAVFFKGQHSSLTPSNGISDIYQKSAPNLISTSVPLGAGFTYLKASIKVPQSNGENGTLFFWPGFQAAANPGVLQPVLTYGPSCAPNPTNIPENGWWISGQYVHQSCEGGPRMALEAGDVVDITMEYNSSDNSWTQTCESNGQTVSYKKDSIGPQTQCIFANENYGNPPGVYEGSYMENSLSLYNVIVKTQSPSQSLASDLRSKLNVVGLEIDPSCQTFNIDRVVIYSPVAR